MASGPPMRFTGVPLRNSEHFCTYFEPEPLFVCFLFPVLALTPSLAMAATLAEP